ncbi:hypothetical protein PPEP_a6001 [Pseudoalteromonas peptidolytica F12-50-A1]|uniref:Uncharacterized protein n=1 Tax=Pseudoalteromonas peptidolytica F12-50-A1 TaxID=1315280 RepID=A0A8I0MRX1_9GAMM|nr:hypothetical protein [Pseudoalteromonas peptidolytica F12-50-A1]
MFFGILGKMNLAPKVMANANFQPSNYFIKRY